MAKNRLVRRGLTEAEASTLFGKTLNWLAITPYSDESVSRYKRSEIKRWRGKVRFLVPLAICSNLLSAVGMLGCMCALSMLYELVRAQSQPFWFFVYYVAVISFIIMIVLRFASDLVEMRAQDLKMRMKVNWQEVNSGEIPACWTAKAQAILKKCLDAELFVDRLFIENNGQCSAAGEFLAIRLSCGKSYYIDFREEKETV